MRGRRRLAAAMVALAIAGCSSTAAVPSGPAAASALGFRGIVPAGRRAAAPQVAAPLLDGGRLSLSSWRGHFVVVNFWASWCAPCRQETTALERAYLATAGLGVRFLGVDEADQAAAARRFRAARRVTYPSLVDRDGVLLARFPELPSALPSSVLLDPAGRVAGVWLGPISGPRLVSLLRSLVAGG